MVRQDLRDPFRTSIPPLLILFIHVQLFSVVPLGVFGGPEKDRCFGFWALSIAPRRYALPAGDPLALLSPSLRVSRTSSCPQTVRPNMLLPPLEDIVWLLTENEGPS